MGVVVGMLFQALLAGSYLSVACAVDVCVTVDSVTVGHLLFQCSSGLPEYFSVDMFFCVLISCRSKAASCFPQRQEVSPCCWCAVTVHRSSAQCLVPLLRKHVLSNCLAVLGFFYMKGSSCFLLLGK